jgi:probable pyridine nucleotide-disulfide oxidoreductase
MNEMHVDGAVIGFGKGGKTLAVFLANQGMQTALIEQSQEMYGGTCINIACIPSKALALAAEAGMGRHFTTFEEQAAYYQEALYTKGQLTSFLRQKNYANVNNNPHAQVIDGKVSFLSPHEMHVKLSSSDEDLLVYAENIFINTGTFPAMSPIAGLTESKRVYNSTSLMELQSLPRELVVIGSGHVGLEFASIYTGFGSRVTVIARSGALLPGYDREIAELVQHTMEQRGIQFRFHSTVQQVQDRDKHTSVTFSDGVEIATDAILLAVGRTPVTKDLALEKAGVAMDERGFIKVDEFLRTTTPNIWALGDVNGGPQFTYISLDDFHIVRDQFGDGKQHSRLDRRNVPSSLFIEPTLSHAGLTTEEAQAQGYEVKVAKLPAAGIPRAQQLQQTDGLLKAVVDAQTGHILGCTLFCADSSEVINTVSMAMNAGLDYTVLRDTIFTHPSMSEALNDLFTQVK